MNFQVPVIQEDCLNVIKVHSEGSSKKKKNKKRKKTKRINNIHINKKSNIQKEKQTLFALSMSSWAESFTVAATWQLKQQLAFWKARAKSLEYENNILHGIIGKQVKNRTSSESSTCKIDTEPENVEIECDNDNDEQNEDLEVSEEFIQFLTANAKYRNDAKRERELLKAKLEAENVEHLEAIDVPEECIEEKVKKAKQLYGNKWERIAALETSLQASFMDECDMKKPTYWPNIPFNFNFV